MMEAGHFEYIITKNQQIQLFINGKELGWIDGITIGVIDDGDEYPPIFDWFSVIAADGSELWNVPELTESAEKYYERWLLDDWNIDFYWEDYEAWKAGLYA